MNQSKKWKLFLDDLRFPQQDEFIIARTVAEAQELIVRLGMPEYISFDHDLGVDEDGKLLPTGFDLVKWIVEMDMDGVITLPDGFNFSIHSLNPVAAENIRHYLDGYMQSKA